MTGYREGSPGRVPSRATGRPRRLEQGGVRAGLGPSSRGLRVALRGSGLRNLGPRVSPPLPRPLSPPLGGSELRVGQLLSRGARPGAPCPGLCRLTPGRGAPRSPGGGSCTGGTGPSLWPSGWNVAVRRARRPSLSLEATRPSPGPLVGSSGSAAGWPGRRPAPCPEPSQPAAVGCRPEGEWVG